MIPKTAQTKVLFNTLLHKSAFKTENSKNDPIKKKPEIRKRAMTLNVIHI